MKQVFLFISILLFLSFCSTPNKENKKNEEPDSQAISIEKIEAVLTSGDTLFSRYDHSTTELKKYLGAKDDYKRDDNNLENIIWFGRRTAYLGRYKDAIDIYTKGLNQFPSEPKLYRHRGHRYISTRQFDKAIADFNKAAELIQDTDDEIEPDGIPNSMNSPLSTLHGNIYYHLGLAHYLKGDMTKALQAYQKSQSVSKNDDMTVSNLHWIYMILRRQGEDEKAQEAVKEIGTKMNIIENMSYHNLCLLYNGSKSVSDFKTKDNGTPSDAAVAYGLANWHLYNGDSVKAINAFQGILKDGNPASFGYIAAESDHFKLKNK